MILFNYVILRLFLFFNAFLVCQINDFLWVQVQETFLFFGRGHYFAVSKKYRNIILNKYIFVSPKEVSFKKITSHWLLVHTTKFHREILITKHLFVQRESGLNVNIIYLGWNYFLNFDSKLRRLLLIVVVSRWRNKRKHMWHRTK